MLITGITGSFGTGKSTAAAMFAELGVKVFDADVCVRRLLANDNTCSRKVIAIFGDGIVTRGKIDRSRLAAVVFNDEPSRRKLMRVIHPCVREKVDLAIEKYRRSGRVKMFMIDAPLIIEAGWHKHLDALIVVKANRTLQLARVQKRTGLKKSDILKRIARQMNIKEKLRLADYVIDNRGSLAQTRRQVKHVYTELMQQCEG